MFDPMNFDTPPVEKRATAEAMSALMIRLAVLVVGDPQRVSTDHHAVTGSETVRDVIGQVNPHLEGCIWHSLVLVRLLFQEIAVELGGLNHLILPQLIGLELFQLGIELAGGHRREILAPVQLAHRMCQCAFKGVYGGFLFRETFLIPGRCGTM